MEAIAASDILQIMPFRLVFIAQSSPSVPPPPPPPVFVVGHLKLKKDF